MSKPLNEELLIKFSKLNKRNDILFQVLELLELFKANDNARMARISGELTELLENEENLKKITKSRNLNELLSTLLALNGDKMIRVYEDSFLRENFPNIASDKFLK